MNKALVIKMLKAVRPRGTAGRVESSLLVRDSAEGRQACAADPPDLYVTIPTDLPVGLYRLVGNDFLTWPKEANVQGNDYPAIPTPPDWSTFSTTIPFPQDALRTALRFVVSNPARPLWGAICFRVSDGHLQIIATDQFALHRYKIPLQGYLPGADYIVQSKAVKTLLMGPATGNLTIRVGDKCLHLATEHLTVIARRLAEPEQYYPIEQLLPETLQYVLSFDAKTLRQAVKDIKPYTCLEDKNGVKITLDRDTKMCRLYAHNPQEHLEKTITVPVEIEASGKRTAADVMLVAPMDTAKSTYDPGHTLQLQHKYLDQVTAGRKGQLYLAQDSEFGKIRPVLFSSTPPAGGAAE